MNISETVTELQHIGIPTNDIEKKMCIRDRFNAVVASNAAAIHLYEKLGFIRLGRVPGGFLNAAGEYEDIWLFYHIL